jgi:hypothetical protein
MIITEKIDGTNAAVIIEEFYTPNPEAFNAVASVKTADDRVFTVGAQSRNRLLSVARDNYGFAAWVEKNAVKLAFALGPGRHFGEWWGNGIQSGYGLPKDDKRFSLFNVNRYGHIDFEEMGLREVSVVPTLYTGPFDTTVIRNILIGLRHSGSYAAPGFMRPEGIVVFHEAANSVFKVLCENDEISKTEAGVA